MWTVFIPIVFICSYELLQQWGCNSTAGSRNQQWQKDMHALMRYDLCVCIFFCKKSNSSIYSICSWNLVFRINISSIYPVIMVVFPKWLLSDEMFQLINICFIEDYIGIYIELSIKSEWETQIVDWHRHTNLTEHHDIHYKQINQRSNISKSAK